MSHLTKIEMSFVIWLNIVTIVARSVCFLSSHMREDVHATHRIVNDGRVIATPNMQKMLL